MIKISMGATNKSAPVARLAAKRAAARISAAGCDASAKDNVGANAPTPKSSTPPTTIGGVTTTSPAKSLAGDRGESPPTPVVGSWGGPTVKYLMYEGKSPSTPIGGDWVKSDDSPDSVVVIGASGSTGPDTGEAPESYATHKEVMTRLFPDQSDLFGGRNHLVMNPMVAVLVTIIFVTL